MAKLSNKDKFNLYIEQVRSGSRPANRYEKLAVERHLVDLQRDDIFFDEKRAFAACNFFHMMKHFKGSYAGKYIYLEPWEVFVVASIFGWIKQKDNKRKYTYADVFVPRKNGKTTLAAGIALFCLLFDGEAGAEVYSAAVDKEQAKICFGTSQELARKSKFSEFVKIYRSSVVVEDTASAYKPLSKDTKNKDGLNPHCSICDERHAWRTNEIYDVIKTGMGARTQPLVFSISTAGTDTSFPYFSDLQVMKDILEGIKKQDNHFVLLFCPDPADDWNDRAVWKKVNPNLGVSLSWDYMDNEYRDAKNKGGSTEANFKTKNLNMWVDAPEVWISDDVVSQCDMGTTDSDLIGQECYAGLDLASHIDINALALYFPKLRALKMQFWLPESRVASVADIVDYKAWVDLGYIKTFPGDVLDVDIIVSDILQLLRRYDTKNLAFDPFKAYHGVIQGLQKAGIGYLLDEYSQGIRNMSEPTKELEKMILAHNIDFMKNPVLRWMFKNVVIYRDNNDNIKVNKGRSRNKVDGVVATINALGGFMSAANRIYENHGLRCV